MLLPLAILASLTYEGNFTQGGLVKLTAPEKTEMKLDGEKVDGFGTAYYIGFGRDAKPQSTLDIKYPDGKAESYQLNVTQREYEVQHINKVDQGKVTPTKTNQKKIEEQAIQVGTARMTADSPCPGNLKFQLPSDTLVTGWFGSQRIYNGVPKAPHSGVDFKGDVGAPAYAPEAGKVIFYQDLFLTGNTMVIDHGCGITSTFLHLSAPVKMPGDEVKKGELVARIGKTGLATGPHLHWNLNIGATRLDGLLVVNGVVKP